MPICRQLDITVNDLLSLIGKLSLYKDPEKTTVPIITTFYLQLTNII